MKERNFILNGYPKSGKTTFVELLSQFCPVESLSIITPIKGLAASIGWDGNKTSKDRDFLSNLKDLIDNYNDYTYRKILESFRSLEDYNHVVIAEMRDTYDIYRAIQDMNAKTILISNNRIIPDYNNHADKNVMDFGSYDYIIYNNYGIIEFGKEVQKFYEGVIL